MKIALVCPNYFLDRSYQENVWAEQLAKAGHRVRVICGGPRHKAVRVIQEPHARYEMHQVKMITLPRSVFITRQAAAAVRAFDPEVIVIHGNKGFSDAVVRDPAMARVPIISTYSENLGMHEFDWRKPGIPLRQRARALGFQLLRGRHIRRNCRRSDLIVGNTLQAREILGLLFRDARERRRIDGKIVDLPLGFSPDHFGHDPAMRKRVRAELSVPDDQVLVCTTSRFDPIKMASINLVIDASRNLMPRHPELRLLVAGFTDSRTSEQVRAHIASGPHADRIIQHPFANRTRLNELFNAADVIVYNLATISCQEALGTGLFACFGDAGTMQHLITRPDQGVLFRPGDEGDLTEKLSRGLAIAGRHRGEARERFRRELAEASRWLGYDRIIASLLDEVRKRTGSAGKP